MGGLGRDAARDAVDEYWLTRLALLRKEWPEGALPKSRVQGEGLDTAIPGGSASTHIVLVLPFLLLSMPT